MLMCFHRGRRLKTCVCVESIRCYCLTSIHSRRLFLSPGFLFLYPHHSIHLSTRCVWVFSVCTLRAKGEKTCGFRLGRKPALFEEKSIALRTHTVLLLLPARQILFRYFRRLYMFNANTVNPTLYSLLSSSFETHSMGLFLCSDFFFFFAVCIKVVNCVVAFALLFYDFFSPFLSVNSGMKE
jgi:hypothetical protein